MSVGSCEVWHKRPMLDRDVLVEKMRGDWRKKLCSSPIFGNSHSGILSVSFVAGPPALTKGRLRTPRSTQVLSTRSLGLRYSISHFRWRGRSRLAVAVGLSAPTSHVSQHRGQSTQREGELWTRGTLILKSGYFEDCENPGLRGY